MRRTKRSGGQRYRGFFRSELDQILSTEELLSQAYILIRRLGFTYGDVKGLTLMERGFFLTTYRKELEEEARATEQRNAGR